MPTIFRSPLITRVARPLYTDAAINAEGFVWSNRLLDLLRSRDTFFYGAGRGPVYDYPNPRGRAYPSDLRTFIDPLKRNLLNQDRFFGAAGQPPSYHWPNPLGKPAAVDLRTWLENLLQTTLGGLVQNPFALLDWQNPRGVTRQIALLPWEQNLLLTTLVSRRNAIVGTTRLMYRSVQFGTATTAIRPSGTVINKR